MWGIALTVYGSGIGKNVWGLGFRVLGSGFSFRVQDLKCACRVWSLGSRGYAVALVLTSSSSSFFYPAIPFRDQVILGGIMSTTVVYTVVWRNPVV